MVSTAFEHIVVGAGIEGLSAAVSLAQHCADTGISAGGVLCLEQFPLPHARGSSMGQTRVTRVAYRNPQYVRMANAANHMWRKVEQRFGQQLYFRTGCLVVGEKGCDAFTEYGRAMKLADAPYRTLDATQLRAQYGHLMQFQDHMAGFYEPDGGLLLSAKCLTALQERLRQLGGTLVDNCPVTAMRPQSDGRTIIQTAPYLMVTSQDGREFTAARSVVVAVGPWAPTFVKQHLDLQLPIEAHKTITMFWPERQVDLYSAQRGTPAVLFAETDYTFYFKPTLEYRGLLQYGAHLGMRADPEKPAAGPDKLYDYYVENCGRIARKYSLKIDASKPAVTENCFYTECVDRDFILDRHPRYPNIIIAAGFSGHGFKMAPVVGELLASLATGTEPQFNMAMFSIARFARPKM